MSAKEMIDEQTKNENTEYFKHFKMHSRSTLKSMTKDELIDYIYMLYKNWSGTDISYNNVMDYTEALQNDIERLKDENNKVYHYVSYLQEYCDNLEKEKKNLIDEVDEYKHEYFSECDLREKLQEENNRLSQQLVECQRVAKQKQEIIDSYLKKVEIDDIKVDSIEQLPIQLIHLQEQQIVEATNTYIASLGCDIRFNRNQMIKILKMYQNPPLKFEEIKEGNWIWDNEMKEYIKCDPGINSLNELCVFYCGTYYDPDDEFEEDYIKFEENRFYRYEVK